MCTIRGTKIWRQNYNPRPTPLAGKTARTVIPGTLPNYASLHKRSTKDFSSLPWIGMCVFCMKKQIAIPYANAPSLCLGNRLRIRSTFYCCSTDASWVMRGSIFALIQRYPRFNLRYAPGPPLPGHSMTSALAQRATTVGTKFDKKAA